ncbi:hypothetical protein FOA52_010465 [Chlamydomonas sp. UWO 241]|nr:hypothetical protein FOA52_010465 [Chlamydomonas sp. UWO 241]
MSLLSAAVAMAARPALLGAMMRHDPALLSASSLRCSLLPGSASAHAPPMRPPLGVQQRGMLWSVEREKGHVYKDPADIINESAIFGALERTKAASKDAAAVSAILEAAKDRSFLTNYTPGKSEYVQGLTLDECATLLNVDATDTAMMTKINDTAFAIKNRIYGNRIVLFAPLYLANYCVNSCAYCAFRGGNKKLHRSALTDDELRAEVAALEEQGHRRLLVLTGEHPKYTPTEAASDEEAGDFYLRVAALADKANDKRDLLIVAGGSQRRAWDSSQLRRPAVRREFNLQLSDRFGLLEAVPPEGADAQAEYDAMAAAIREVATNHLAPRGSRRRRGWQFTLSQRTLRLMDARQRAHTAWLRSKSAAAKRERNRANRAADAAVQRDRERWIGQQVAEAQDMLRKKNLSQFARACDRLAGRSRSHQIPPAMRDVSGALHSGPDGVLKAMTESFDKLYGGETKLSDETLNQLENDVAAFELTRATEVDEAHGRPPDLAETEACVRALRSAAAPGGDQLDAMLLRFDQFLHAIDIIGATKSEPCGSIRRINVEIPTLSVSDMRRLKATDKIGTFTLFQETYHRETFRTMHISGPKSDYNYRLLTQDRAMRGGIDDVGIGTLFGLFDYRFEVLAMLQHAEHLEKEYGAGPHTISVPRMRPADGSELSVTPPHVVDDDNFKKLVAIIRIAVPYTGMILSTRESPEMRSELLRVGMSQMSAGSKTDVGAYHRDHSETTEKELGDLPGQFSLMDHRATPDVVKQLMLDGYVPSWCTACYRKGRTGEHFMKIAKAGNIHSFCHPNSILSLQEYLKDYGTEEMQKIGKEVIEREMDTGLTDSAKRMLTRKMTKVDKGEHDHFMLSIPVARGANWFLSGGGRRMDEEEATAAAAERIAAAAEDGTSLPVCLATDVVRFLYGGTGRREPADGGVVSASLLNAKPAVGGIGMEPRGGGVLRLLFTVTSDAVADTVVRWRHELRRCVDSTAVFDVLSDREEAQHQALWPAFLAAKVAGKRAQFHRARLVVDGERVPAPAC